MRFIHGVLLLMCLYFLQGSSSSTLAVPVSQNGCNSELNENCLDLEGITTAPLIVRSGSNETREGVVMSITSFWRDSDFRTGGTRIRVWSREELIENSVFLIDVQPISVDFRIRPSSLAGTRANDFDIVFTDPAASASSETILEPIVYDIISLFGIPTATIQATVNGLTSGPIVVTGVASSRNQAMTEIDLLADSNTVDLPPSIPASGVVDQELEQQASGLQVYYEYVLRGTEPTDQFPIEVSARINYRVSERGTSGPYFPETTDYASLTYLTTGEFSEVYSQVYLPLVRRN